MHVVKQYRLEGCFVLSCSSPSASIRTIPLRTLLQLVTFRKISYIPTSGSASKPHELVSTHRLNLDPDLHQTLLAEPNDPFFSTKRCATTPWNCASNVERVTKAGSLCGTANRERCCLPHVLLPMSPTLTSSGRPRSIWSVHLVVVVYQSVSQEDVLRRTSRMMFKYRSRPEKTQSQGEQRDRRHLEARMQLRRRQGPH